VSVFACVSVVHNQSIQLSPKEALCNRPRPRCVQENGAKQFPEFSRELHSSFQKLGSHTVALVGGLVGWSVIVVYSTVRGVCCETEIDTGGDEYREDRLEAHARWPQWAQEVHQWTQALHRVGCNGAVTGACCGDPYCDEFREK
jgi:hypothetical protein